MKHRINRLYNKYKNTIIMTKTKKLRKAINDPFAFKGLEKPNVVFSTTLPDYQGTQMIIKPLLKKTK